MKCLNQVILFGSVGRIEEKENCLKLSLATSEKWFKEEEEHEKTTWHNVTIFNPLADSIKEHVKVGERLFIQGKISNSSYEKDGEKRFNSEIIANNIIF